MTKRPKVLFVTYGGGHVNIVLGVLEALSHRETDAVILGLTTARPRLEAAGYAVLGFADFADVKRDAAALAIGRELAADIRSGGAAVSAEESVAYLGLSMWELITRVGETRARELLRLAGRAVWSPVSVLDRVVGAVKPDVVVTTNSPRAERAALVVAERRRIPSLRIEDLFGCSGIVGQVRHVIGEDVTTDIIDTIRPTAVAVMNEIAADNVLRDQEQEQMAVVPDRVVVTGQPVFDAALARRSTANSRAIRLASGLPLDRPVLAWATDNLSCDDEILDALLTVMSHRSEWHLRIKPHPGVTAEVAARYVALACENVSVAVAGDLQELFLASNVALSHFSTAGLEAIVLGRPLCLFDILGDRLDNEYAWLVPAHRATIPYLSLGASAVIRSFRELPQRLDELLERDVSALQTPKAFVFEPGAAERIAELILRLAGDGSAEV